MPNPFLDGSNVASGGGGRYTATIDEIWNLRPLPQGGIVTALALRAMAAELADSSQTLRTSHTIFAAQVAAGPVEIEVELLRRGRSMSHLRAEVRNVGAARGHLTTAAFGSTREGFDFTDLRPPSSLPLPADCPSFRDPPPDGVELWERMPFWEEVVEGRPVLGHAPWEEYVPDRAERASWTRFDQPPFISSRNGSRGGDVIDPLSLAVLVDTMPGAVSEVTSSGRQWFAPSVDLTFHLLGECRSPWVLAHNTARHAGDGYASADMALWDYGPTFDDPRLVAYATQVFLFTMLG